MNPCFRKCCRSKVPETHFALFKRFIDGRTYSNLPFTRSLFLLKAQDLYEDLLIHHPNTPGALKFFLPNLGWKKRTCLSLSFHLNVFLSQRQIASLDCRTIWVTFIVSVAIVLKRFVLIPLLLIETKWLFFKIGAATGQF